MPLGGQALQATPAVVSINEQTLQSPTNTAPGNGSPLAGVAFTAPQSGQVLVLIGSDMAPNCLVGVRIRLGAVIGSGTLIDGGEPGDGPSSQRLRLLNLSTARVSASAAGVIVGLTPGTVYNACIFQYVTSGTGSLQFRSVTVMPVI